MAEVILKLENVTIHQKEIPVYIQMSLAIKYPYILASFTS